MEKFALTKEEKKELEKKWKGHQSHHNVPFDEIKSFIKTIAKKEKGAKVVITMFDLSNDKELRLNPLSFYQLLKKADVCYNNWFKTCNELVNVGNTDSNIASITWEVIE